MHPCLARHVPRSSALMRRPSHPLMARILLVSYGGRSGARDRAAGEHPVGQGARAPRIALQSAEPRQAVRQPTRSTSTPRTGHSSPSPSSPPRAPITTSGTIPKARLYPQVVGYASEYYGTAGIENEYNENLVTHTLPAQTFSQTLGFSPLQTSRDNLTLTIDPSPAAGGPDRAEPDHRSEQGCRGRGRHPKDRRSGRGLLDTDVRPECPGLTGCGRRNSRRSLRLQREGPGRLLPGRPVGDGVDLFPGSTFKVVTTTAVYNLAPQLSNFTFPPPRPRRCRTPTSAEERRRNGLRWRHSGDAPQSCDPGYGLLGIALGAPTLSKQADLFGYNSTPPIDLPKAWVATPFFPPASSISPPNQAYLAYSAIGQFNVTASALSNALVAAGVANGGVIMEPYLVQQIHDTQGAGAAAPAHPVDGRGHRRRPPPA